MGTIEVTSYVSHTRRDNRKQEIYKLTIVDVAVVIIFNIIIIIIIIII